MNQVQSQNGFPRVLALLRTPFYVPHSFMLTLIPRIPIHGASKELPTTTESDKTNANVEAEKVAKSLNEQEKKPIKEFEFPADIFRPQCKL